MKLTPQPSPPSSPYAVASPTSQLCSAIGNPALKQSFGELDWTSWDSTGATGSPETQGCSIEFPGLSETHPGAIIVIFVIKRSQKENGAKRRGNLSKNLASVILFVSLFLCFFVLYLTGQISSNLDLLCTVYSLEWHTILAEGTSRIPRTRKTADGFRVGFYGIHYLVVLFSTGKERLGFICGLRRSLQCATQLLGSHW